MLWRIGLTQYGCSTMYGLAARMRTSIYNLTREASPARILTGICGPLLLGLGSGISVSAGFGAFGFSVLLDGLHTGIGVPLWLSQIAITLLFYGVAILWAGIPLGVGTIPSLLLIGPAISLGSTVAPENLAFAGHVAAFAIGLFLFAFGISLAAAAALGPDGITALSLAAEQRTNFTIPQSNFLLNFSAIAIGITLGGKFGVATIFALIVVPILIKHMLPILREWLLYQTAPLV